MANNLQGGGAYLEASTREDLLLVDAYGDHGFRIHGRRVEGAVMVLENGFHPVEGHDLSSLNPESVTDIVALCDTPELILVGTGQRMALLPKAVREHFEKNKLAFELMDTGAAARTFNVLRMEGRRVAALLLPVE